MYLNIVTPCSRPENLVKISQSINIPTENYRWIVVFDMDEIPQGHVIPSNCETYLHKNPQSTVGHAQRNFALDLIHDGHVYMNDDDTTIHPELWENIKDLDCDFISFKQNGVHGNLRLHGDTIQVYHIDSHNFIVSKKAIGDIQWIIDRYDADGYFANHVHNRVVNDRNLSKCYIPKVLSIYNSLR